MDTLVLVFDAPLASYGGPAVDERRVSQEVPTLSQVTGLLANALGYDHRDATSLQRLQSRLQMAVRRDRPGRRLVDFQTVDLGQSHLLGTGWTTRGVPEGRRGGESSEGTRILTKEYWAGAVHVVFVRLQPAEESPTIRDVQAALDAPFRPLFLGRKSCIPARRLVGGLVSATTLRDALRKWPREGADLDHGSDSDLVDAWWPASEGIPEDGYECSVCDERDWANQIHAGERRVVRGRVQLDRSAART